VDAAVLRIDRHWIDRGNQVCAGKGHPLSSLDAEPDYHDPHAY
jgi:hypothetical protein